MMTGIGTPSRNSSNERPRPMGISSALLAPRLNAGAAGSFRNGAIWGLPDSRRRRDAGGPKIMLPTENPHVSA
ncbi:hypothetical protein FRZ61_43720 [Hypericibacter adhaerens]|uniref:Uncharacterized protein n=1 Tax=Hypericibacter adhaerens TaxID=2602016 RepID=A0A5J6N3N3_9PROT|nr:hypothetical protein FRZ61_43720 [Hypericibacter adhaerens]